MRRKRRIATIASFLATGAIILQLGPVCSVASTGFISGAGRGGLFVDDNGNLLGLPGVNLCGIENTQLMDTTTQITGPVLNAEDDLIFGCPIRIIESANTSGTGGG